MKPHCLCYIILLFSLLVGAHCADDDDECVECMECEECKKSEECAECEECEECESEEVQPERGDYEVYDRSGEERNTVYDHTNMKDTGRNGNLDPMKQKVLNMHNEFRRKLNRADVSDLAWDEELEELGQTMADKCQYGYLYESEVESGGYGNIGQNIAHDRTVEEDFQQWTDQRRDPRHYKQLVSADAKFVGCGVRKCETGGYYLVCFYRPGNNLGGNSGY